jgi:ATP-binding cassette subfamily B protein
MSLRASFDSVLGGDSRRASGADDPVAGDDLEAALGGGSPATAVPQDELKAVALGKILQLSKPEWPALCSTIIFVFGSELCNLYNPIVLAKAYNAIIDPTTTPDTKRAIVREAMLLVFALQIAGQILGYIKGLLVGFVGERVVCRVRNRLYRTMLSFEMGFFDAHKTGGLTSRVSADTQSIQAAASGALPDLLYATAKFCVTVGLMGTISGQMTGYVILGTLATFLVVMPTAKKIGTTSKRYQDALAEAGSVAVEALGSMKTVKAFVGEDVECKRFSAKIGDLQDTKCWLPTDGPDTTLRLGLRRVVLIVNAFTGGFGVFFLMFSAVTWLGFDRVIEGEITLGDLTAFNSYAFSTLFVIAQLGGAATKLISAKGAAQRVFELLEREPKIPRGGHRPEQMMGEVELEGVTFSYPTRPDITVLKDFSLRVPTNSTTAMVGASGSGKSTVISLLQRFYDVQEGRVLVDGRDIRDLDSDWLGANIGFVQQEPSLFGMTIKGNLTYALPREASDREIADACKRANAHLFITDFPEGYETLIGERGLTLSGGQKQRLAIARALLVDPRVLLLDEATSALDAESEHLVQEAIGVLMEGRTTIIVAHRLSTIRNADQIVVVNKATINDIGTHDELLGRCEQYQELVRLQMGQAQAEAAPGQQQQQEENGQEVESAAPEETVEAEADVEAAEDTE